MSDQVLGLFFVFLIGIALVLIFNREQKTGVRAFRHVREHIDFLILKTSHSIRLFFRSVGRGVVRQTFHYFFHAVLASFLFFFERAQTLVKTTMNSNRATARRVQRERASRSKLEEIALHKMATALSDDEKRARRSQSLNE